MQLDDYMKLPYAITLRPDEDGDWIAEIETLEGCVAHGDTQAEALQRIEEVKRLWIQAGLEHGQPIPTPRDGDSLPSGKWLQRVPRSLHKNLARLAKIEGTSLNQLVTSILSEYVGITKRAGTVSWMSTPGPISGMGMITMHGVSAHNEGGYTVTRQAYNEGLR